MRPWCAIVLAPLLTPFLIAACGGGGHPEVPIGTNLLPEAGASTTAAQGTPLTGARTPPPFALGSKHVDKKSQASPACHATEHSPQKDPKAALGAIATACKVKAEGAPFTGQQDSVAVAQSFDLKGAKGQCYRVAAATGSGVKGLVVTLMDAEGAIAAEYHTDDIATAVAPEEALCFKDDATLKVSASVGAGSGAFAVQIMKE
jgi:hypothetical protein